MFVGRLADGKHIQRVESDVEYEAEVGGVVRGNGRRVVGAGGLSGERGDGLGEERGGQCQACDEETREEEHGCGGGGRWR